MLDVWTTALLLALGIAIRDSDLAVELKIPNSSITNARQNFDILAEDSEILLLASGEANVYYVMHNSNHGECLPMTMRRRDFMRSASITAAGFALASKYSAGVFAQSADAHIEVVLDEPLGTISPNIYGHFTENLSGVIYDGIWVGEDSKVPNIHGIRKELIDEMRKINPPIVRFPGGCFADSYDWRDGIGPADKRPRRTNFWAGGETAGAPASHRYDPNRFGTNEFVQFCRLLGAQPYLAANVRSLPAEEFYRWVEYCNSPAGSTTLADERAAAGFKDPFNVRYWGVGNEAWGCGGNFTPQA